MALTSQIGTELDPVETCLQAIVDRQTATEEDVSRLRQAFYRRNGVDRDLAARVFQAHRSMPSPDPACSAAAERMLLDWIGDGASSANFGERRLILRLMFRAATVSERFQRFVLAMLRDNLVDEEHRLLSGEPRRPGEIDAIDLQLIRKVIYGAGGQYPIAVGRAAADFLFDLGSSATGFTDPAAWRALFVKAIAMHLLLAGRTPGCVDDDQAAWLIDRLQEPCAPDDRAALLGHLRAEGVSLPAALAALGAGREA